jgi:cyclopropane fatty-acyl-phospholipid synthase-like methyltransferase
VLKAVFHKRWIGQQSFTTTDELDTLFSALGPRPDAHVLDIGCGMGGPAIYLARRAGCHVTGIDASPASIGVARDTAIAAAVAERVRFVSGDVLEIDVPAEVFDAIVGQDVFVTIANPARLFAVCHRAFRPAGL